MKICSTCQTKNSDESTFCKKCGKKLKKEADVSKIVLLVGVFLVLFASIFFGILNWEHMEDLFRFLFFCFETCLFFILSLALKRVSNVTSRIFFVIGLILVPFTLTLIPYYDLFSNILRDRILIFTYLAVIYILTFGAYKLINLKFKCKVVDYLALLVLLLGIMYTVKVFTNEFAIAVLAMIIYMFVLTILSRTKYFKENKSYYVCSVILSFLVIPFLLELYGRITLMFRDTTLDLIISIICTLIYLADGYIKMFNRKTVLHFFNAVTFQFLTFVLIANIFSSNEVVAFIILSVLNIAFYFVSLIFKSKLYSITTLVLTYIMLSLLIMMSLIIPNYMMVVIISALFLLFNLSILIIKKYNFVHFLMTVNILTLVIGLNAWLFNFDAFIIITFLVILYLVMYIILNIMKNKYDFMYLILVLVLGFVAFIIGTESSFSIIKLIICQVFVIGYVLINLLKEHISIRVIWYIILNFLILVLFSELYYSVLTLTIFDVIICIILQKATKFNFKVHLLIAEIIIFIMTLCNTMEHPTYTLFINVLAYILGYVSVINFHNKKGWKIPYIMVGLLFITKLLDVIIDQTVIASLLSILINLIVITSMYLLDRFKSKELIIISLITLIPYYSLVNGLYNDLYVVHIEPYLLPLIVYHIIMIFTIKWKNNESRNVFILIPFFLFVILFLLNHYGVVSIIFDAAFAVAYIIVGLIKKFNLLIYFSIAALILMIVFQLFTVLSSMAAIISILVLGFVLIFVAVIYSTRKKD